jgi:hypothetical protein
MSPRSKLLFLLLVIAQVAHSVEEYVTQLFEVFAPARFVSGLFTENLPLGFAVVNAALVAIGAWCYLGPVRAGGAAGQTAAVLWIAIELVNGAVHIGIAASRGEYFSGSLTAVLLVITAACLAVSVLTDRRRGAPVAGGAA